MKTLGTWVGCLRRLPSLAIVAALWAGDAEAAIVCGPPNGAGVQTCTAGLPSDMAGTIQAFQSQSQWCWAASISMILRHHGHEVQQDRIVSEAWGAPVNMPGGPETLLASLNRVWTDARGKRFRVVGDVFSANPVTAAQDLADGHPLLIGTMGHAMVLTAVTYQRDVMGNGVVVEAVVRDPWPGRGRRTLTAQEWLSTTFLARIRVSDDHDDDERPCERIQCQHPRHPAGHPVACSHPAHPYGHPVPCNHRAHQADPGPCMHGCPGPYCHPWGDPYPCTHPAHVLGDGVVPCAHAAHSMGHPVACEHPAHPGGHSSCD